MAAFRTHFAPLPPALDCSKSHAIDPTLQAVCPTTVSPLEADIWYQSSRGCVPDQPTATSECDRPKELAFGAPKVGIHDVRYVLCPPTLIPMSSACLATDAARIMSSYELLVQLPMRPAFSVLGHPLDSTCTPPSYVLVMWFTMRPCASHTASAALLYIRGDTQQVVYCTSVHTSAVFYPARKVFATHTSRHAQAKWVRNACISCVCTCPPGC